IGWAFGFGYFLVGLYWIGFAFLVEADQFAWLIPFAIAAMPAGLAIFSGLAVVVARLLWRPGYARVVALAVAWGALEWVRSEILTGFPWNLLGQTLAFSDSMIQGAAFVGDLGLSLLVVLVAGAPACLADSAGQAGWRRWRPLVIAGAGLLVIYGAGSYRLLAVVENVPDVRLRIVQPNIAQTDKWKPEQRSDIIARMLELSNTSTSPESMGVEDVTHLIWPETALPLIMQQEPEVMAAVAALLPPGTALLTGALRLAPPAPGGTGNRIFNSIFEIDADGRIGAVYDKRRLVPFGEYLPWRRWLSRIGLRQLTAQRRDFTAGTSISTMQVAGVPLLAASICYEIIFSGHIATPNDRPGWILNVTNDAWFGDSPGPYQHLAQARLRAVEQGLPLVRAANTGISAIIDPYGRLVKQLPLGVRGVIDAKLPAALPATVFARIGSRTLGIGLGVVLVLLGLFNILMRMAR
ncbi:MAG: apolipoprotein N-acyltransferase, partial [Hyphomicrobiales bacterium]